MKPYIKNLDYQRVLDSFEDFREYMLKEDYIKKVNLVFDNDTNEINGFKISYEITITTNDEKRKSNSSIVKAKYLQAKTYDKSLDELINRINSLIAKAEQNNDKRIISKTNTVIPDLDSVCKDYKYLPGREKDILSVVLSDTLLKLEDKLIEKLKSNDLPDVSSTNATINAAVNQIDVKTRKPKSSVKLIDRVNSLIVKIEQDSNNQMLMAINTFVSDLNSICQNYKHLPNHEKEILSDTLFTLEEKLTKKLKNKDLLNISTTNAVINQIIKEL